MERKEADVSGQRNNRYYPLSLPSPLYDAVKQVARERGTKLKKDVYMKDVIIAALITDPEIAKHYNKLKRAREGVKNQ